MKDLPLIHPRLLLVPDPRLRQPSIPVDEKMRDQVPQLVALMKEVLVACRAAGINTASISAPQVGYPWRIFLLDSPAVEILAINPEITKTAGDQTYLEGCLSFPVGTLYAVKRAKIVKFHYTDQTGRIKGAKFHDIYASVIQHECDHLNGILIDDRGLPAS